LIDDVRVSIWLRRRAEEAREEICVRSLPAFDWVERTVLDGLRQLPEGEDLLLPVENMNVPQEQFGRILSFLSREDLSISVEENGLNYRIRRGERQTFRLWRLLSELRKRKPNKGKHRIRGPVPFGTLRAPSACLMEVGEDNYGHRRPVPDEGGWRRYMPTLEDVLSVLVPWKPDVVSIFTSQGEITIQRRVGPIRGMLNYLKLSLHYSDLDSVRNAPEIYGARYSNRRRFIEILQNRYGVSFTYAPYEARFSRKWLILSSEDVGGVYQLDVNGGGEAGLDGGFSTHTVGSQGSMPELTASQRLMDTRQTLQGAADSGTRIMADRTSPLLPMREAKAVIERILAKPKEVGEVLLPGASSQSQGATARLGGHGGHEGHAGDSGFETPVGTLDSDATPRRGQVQQEQEADPWDALVAAERGEMEEQTKSVQGGRSKDDGTAEIGELNKEAMEALPFKERGSEAEDTFLESSEEEETHDETLMEAEDLGETILEGEPLDETIEEGMDLADTIEEGMDLADTIEEGEALEETILEGEPLDETIEEGMDLADTIEEGMDLADTIGEEDPGQPILEGQHEDSYLDVDVETTIEEPASKGLEQTREVRADLVLKPETESALKEAVKVVEAAPVPVEALYVPVEVEAVEEVVEIEEVEEDVLLDETLDTLVPIEEGLDEEDSFDITPDDLDLEDTIDAEEEEEEVPTETEDEPETPFDDTVIEEGLLEDTMAEFPSTEEVKSPEPELSMEESLADTIEEFPGSKESLGIEPIPQEEAESDDGTRDIAQTRELDGLDELPVPQELGEQDIEVDVDILETPLEEKETPEPDHTREIRGED